MSNEHRMDICRRGRPEYDVAFWEAVFVELKKLGLTPNTATDDEVLAAIEAVEKATTSKDSTK